MTETVKAPSAATAPKAPPACTAPKAPSAAAVAGRELLRNALAVSGRGSAASSSSRPRTHVRGRGGQRRRGHPGRRGPADRPVERHGTGPRGEHPVLAAIDHRGLPGRVDAARGCVRHQRRLPRRHSCQRHRRRPAGLRRADGTGFAGTVIHVADVGGESAGGVAVGASEIYGEGIQLPPVRIATDDGLVEEVAKILALNSRAPEGMLGDVRALVAGCNVAARRLEGIVERRGADAFRGGGR